MAERIGAKAVKNWKVSAEEYGATANGKSLNKRNSIYYM